MKLENVRNFPHFDLDESYTLAIKMIESLWEEFALKSTENLPYLADKMISLRVYLEIPPTVSHAEIPDLAEYRSFDDKENQRIILVPHLNRIH